jgi:hypothetical protein
MSESTGAPRVYTGAEFLGRWVGQTQGYDSPAHHWEISQERGWLRIDTQWEGEGNASHFYAVAVAGRPELRLDPFVAALIDPQHFVIAGWDTNDTRAGQGPAFDVVFSRPGIAELSATRAYARWLESRDAGEREV